MFFDERGWNIDLENRIGIHKNGITMGFNLKDNYKVTGVIVNEPNELSDEEYRNFYIGGCMSFIETLKNSGFQPKKYVN